MKQIPNIFTLLNLFFGCMAIVCIMQPGLMGSYDSYGLSIAAGYNDDGSIAVSIPEKMYWAPVFIGLAAVIDFLDGFVARLMKASSEMGKQLDSLADVVSFGVAPGLILYQFLRFAYAQQQDGLDISIFWLLPAFLVPCAGAYRLARFNIDTNQSHGFKGLPIPSAGLLIASIPLIRLFSNDIWAQQLMVNKWFLYGIIFIVSYLMVSKIPMIALKFKNVSIKDNWEKYLLALTAIVSVIVFKWLAVPIVLFVYILLSLVTEKKQETKK